MSFSFHLKTPLGPMQAELSEHALAKLSFSVTKKKATSVPGVYQALAAEIEGQINRYFDGILKEFSLPLEPAGTDFEKRTWSELERIPWGTTTSYGEIAQRLGDPNLSRAVGRANGANPIAICIPCHRVIGASGDLTGYAGGLDKKKALLDLESPQQSLF